MRNIWNAGAAASPIATWACPPGWLDDFSDDIERIDVPTLILHGTADRILPIDGQGRRLHAALPDARYVEIEGDRTSCASPMPRRSTASYSASCARPRPSTPASDVSHPTVMTDALTPLPSARDIRGPSPLVAIEDEPPPQLIVDPPLPGPLAAGKVFIQYRAENLRIVPVVRPGCPRCVAAHRPRPYHRRRCPVAFRRCQRRDGDPGRPASGPHRVLFELANPVHQVITSKTVEFTVPG